MQTVRKITMLDALGVVVYSRVRLVKVRSELKIPSNPPVATIRSDVRSGQDSRVPAPLPVAVLPTPSLGRPVAKLLIANRAASVRSELVLPSAEIERFLESRMYSHFCLLLAHGMRIPVVENAVVSDTALHFELPPKAPLKLGSMALLRSAWRAKRQAWLAIRLWRKQQR